VSFRFWPVSDRDGQSRSPTGVTLDLRLFRGLVDLSPSTAERIGITQDNGVAKVKVTPISVPLPDGSTISGIETPDSKP